MPYIVNGNDESGYHVTDPDGHIIPVGSRWAAENYAQQQNQLLQQRGTAYVPPESAESIGENLKSCAYMIVGIVIAVIVIALIVNFIILHGWWPFP